MERKRNLGLITDDLYNRVLHMGLYTTPRGRFSLRMMERLETENPYIDSILRGLANRASNDNKERVADLFFVQYEMLNRARSLPLFSDQDIARFGPILNKELSCVSSYFSQVKRISIQNPNFIRLVGTFVKGATKATAIDEVSSLDEMDNVDLLTDSEKIRSIPDANLMLFGSIRHYLVLESA